MNAKPPTQLPPQDRDAEQRLIGSLLREAVLLDDVYRTTRPEDFYFDAHQKLYAIMLAEFVAGRKCDLELLPQKLKDRGWYEDVGGATYIVELWEATPTGANGTYLASIVRDKATYRRLIHQCTQIIGDAYDEVNPPAELVAKLESSIFAIGENAISSEPVRIGQAMQELIIQIDERMSKGHSPYIPSGLQELDQIIGGFRDGELTALGARPSHGKSAAGLKVAINSSLNHGRGVLVFSLEMAAIEWAARVMAGHTGIPLNIITNSMNIEEATMSRLRDGAQRYGDVVCMIDDNSTHSMATIAAVARRAVRKHKVGLIIIDYLQLIDHAGFKSDSMDVRIGNTSRALKVLARSLKVPVICLAQLNREPEKRADGRPTMADFRGSGNIEQDADNVLLLWPVNHQTGEDMPPIQEIRILVDKQRNGPRGEAHVEYVRELTRFQDAMPRYST